MIYDLSREELAQFNEGIIGFNIVRLNNKRVEFKVYHNLADAISSAITNWSVRTRKHTAESLCEYINNKHSGHLCFTEEQWKPYYNKLFNLN